MAFLFGLGACSSDDEPAVAGGTTEASGSDASDGDAPPDGDAPADDVEPVTVVKPPDTADGPLNASPLDLDAEGYVEEEFFYEGDASGYVLTSESSPDGVWETEEADSAPYRSRILVRRPADAADFSGVVLVEWMNVSGGVDGEPDWGYTSQEIIREGHAWVGVSAQSVGVLGDAESFAGEEGGLVKADAERYGTLEHPGDAYSFDIFTQAGRAVLVPDGPDPLGSLEPSTVIAMGESQSASFLTTYINGVHPLAQLYDGFLIHSRGARTPELDGARSDDRGDASDRILIRTDLDQPVLLFETETDMNVLGYAAVRQDDSETVKAWEVAGTAHADNYLLNQVYGDVSEAVVGACLGMINDGPQRWVLRAALHRLVAWVSDGTEPPESPRLTVTEDAESAYAYVIEKDDDGNAVGGVRTPAVDAPIATLDGDPVPGSPGFCEIFGSTTPFDAAKLTELYGDPAGYLEQFDAALSSAVDAGFVLEPDADLWRDEAAKFTW